jgi:nicotinamide mononucleotide transporter
MFETIINQYKNVPNWQILLEVIVFFFGILSVYFAKKENIMVYPTGLVSTILSVYIMYKAQYFADMNINIYYSIMSIYGWYCWTNKIAEKPLTISRTSDKEKLIGLFLGLLTAIFCYIIYTLFKVKFELNNYLDLLSSGIFFTAMWFMARKKIENWPLWIIGNIIVIYLFIDRQLYIIALQYIIFTILAFSAYFTWKKHLQNKI